MFQSFLILVAMIALFVWTQREQKARLQRWATEHRFEILDVKLCLFLRGPFQWTSSRHQSVYRVHILDGHGQPFAGWVCIGYFDWFSPNDLRAEWDGLEKPRSY